ncbi:hypothetical protein GCM10009771_13730 [Nesterenkonia flava]
MVDAWTSSAAVDAEAGAPTVRAALKANAAAASNASSTWWGRRREEDTRGEGIEEAIVFLRSAGARAPLAKVT